MSVRLLALVALLAALALGYSVFWGEFVVCDVGSCPYPNPEGRFLEVGDSYVRFDTSSDPAVMGFYVVAVRLGGEAELSLSGG